MSAIFARGLNGVNGGQHFKMPQSLQKAHQITCLVVQNLKGIVCHISDMTFRYAVMTPKWKGQCTSGHRSIVGIV